MKHSILQRSIIAMSLAASSLLAAGNAGGGAIITATSTLNIGGQNIPLVSLAGGETSARLDALGLTGYQTTDSYNIWANPAFMQSNANEATVNVRGQNTASVMAGGNYKTPAGTFGFYFGRPSIDNGARMHGSANANALINGAVNGVAFNYPAGATPTVPLTPVNQFDLMYAIGINSDIDLGARLSRKRINNSFKSSAGTTTSETNLYNTETELEAGAVLKSIGLDVSFALTLPYYEQSQSAGGATTKVADKGAFMWSLQGGFNLPVNSGSKLRLHAIIANGNLDSELTSGNSSQKRTEGQFIFNSTATLDQTLSETTHLFLSAGLQYLSLTQELANTNPLTGKVSSYALQVPLVGAVESEFIPKWTARAGASISNLTLLNGIKVETVGQSSAESSPSVPMNVGLNAGLGYSPVQNVDIDAVLSQGVLFGGGNVLAGLTSKITANIRF